MSGSDQWRAPRVCTDYLETIRAAIVVELGRGPPQMRRVAALTGVSLHEMQHELGIRGTCYAEVLEAVRREAGRRMVADSDMPLMAIALSLGYARPGSFSRAFRRWTGMSPRSFRSARGRP